jgi:hypothetical protein
VFINLTVQNLPATAMLDTGATPNLISRTFYEKLLAQRRQQPVTIRENARRLVTANSEPVHVSTCVDVTLRLGGLSVPCSLVVIDNLCHQILLGLEFLRNTQADIHLTSGTLSLYQGLVHVPLIEGGLQPTVHTVANISIPPNSQSLFTVKTRAKLPPGTYEIEQHPSRCNQKFLIAHSVGQLNDGHLVCCALNPTDRPIRISKRSPVGTIAPVSVIKPAEIPPPPIQGELPTIDQMRNILEKEKKLSFQDTAVTGHEFDQLITLLYRNRDLFATSLAELSRANVPPFTLDVQGAAPYRARPIRYTPQQKAEIERQVQEMYQADIIESSDSPWQSNIVLVRKGTGWRFAIDFRFLNSLSRMESFPIPTFPELCDRIVDQGLRPENNLSANPHRRTLFVSIDLRSGYWQTPVDENSRKYLAFHTENEAWQFKVLPFGISSAGSYFQRTVNRVLSHLPFALAYLDDILCVAHNADDLNIKIQRIFNRLRGANLKIHPEKCHWAVTKVKFLGHELENGKLMINSDKLSIVRNYPPPQNQKQLRAYLGLSTYFRKFLKGYAQTTFPLRQLLKKDVPYVWDKACQDAFEQINHSLLNAPVLLLPDYNKKSVILTDASVKALGYALCQYDDQGKLHPCLYSGRALRPAETRYNISQLEMLAVVEAVKEFHVYVANQHFEIWTDHIANTYYRSMKMSDNNRVTRWLLFLSPYSFDICYRKGATHTVPDALSRRPWPEDERTPSRDEYFRDTIDLTPGPETPDLASAVTHNGEPTSSFTFIQFAPRDNTQHVAAVTTPLALPTLAEVKNALIDCPDFGPMIKFLSEGILPENPTKARSVQYDSQNYVFESGILYHLYTPRTRHLQRALAVTKQLCIPTSLREKLAYALHDSCGHPGIQRLYALARTRYYFPRMYEYVQNYARCCLACQKAKPDSHPAKTPVLPLPILEPGQIWNADFHGSYNVNGPTEMKNNTY